jgi:hypothetical protein
VEELRSAVAILRGNRGDTHATADALESLADALEATDGPSEEAKALRAEARGTKQGSGK